MRTVFLSSKHFEMLYNLAEIEATFHAEALSRYLPIDEFTTGRLLKLHLLNILGWNTSMVDEIEIVVKNHIENRSESEKQKEIKEIISIYDFYQEVNPVEYYDFLLQKIGDPYKVAIIWRKVV
jgi:hypothetical protein